MTVMDLREGQPPEWAPVPGDLFWCDTSHCVKMIVPCVCCGNGTSIAWIASNLKNPRGTCMPCYRELRKK